MMYNKIVLDCFFKPKHVGNLPQDNACSASISHYVSGEIARLSIVCDESPKIVAARFKASGHPYLIAALEWVCRQIENDSLAHHPAIDYQRLVDELEIPRSQYPHAVQVVDLYVEVILLMKNILGAQTL